MPTTIIQFIDLKAFSNVWYWVTLALIWTRVMQAPMGVPVDLVRAAQRGRERAVADVRALATIEARYRIAVGHSLGEWRVAAWYFVISALFVLAIVYGVEMAQAAFLIAAPFGVVRHLGGRAAKRVAGADDDATVLAVLARLRWQVQAIGFASVFVSALFGMAHNVATGAFP